MEQCILEITDQVNVRFRGLDVETRRKISEALKFFVPYARHMPAFKLGRWDGKVSFCTVGGMTYLNLLDRILPIIDEAGYEIEIDDKRPPISFDFPEITEYLVADTCWPEGHVAAGKPIMLRDYQVDAIKRYLANPQSIQSISTGAGKSQPLWSKIKTPNGWIKMAEAQIGTVVSTPDGGSARVVGVYPQGTIPYYRVHFKDGRTAEACGNHLWDAYCVDWKHAASRGHSPWKTISTEGLIRHLERSSRPVKIPLLIPTEEKAPADLPLDPYILGALIGDGSLAHEVVGFSSADAEIIEKISDRLHCDYELRHRTAYDYNLVFKADAYRTARSAAGANLKGHWNHYKTSLVSLGLQYTKSASKFIPQVYLEQANLSQKLELIQGLIDTDGHVGRNGEISFTTVSKQLSEDFAYLIRSIGGTASTSTRTPTYQHKGERRMGQLAYTVRVRYRSPRDLVSLTRKRERISENYQYADSLKLQITKIEKIGETECQCIMIDHPDHLYITDNFVVTHNTLTTACLSKLAEPYGRSIVIVPSKSLVEQTEEDYRNLGLDVGVYYGDRKEWGKTHTISTWQSLVALSKRGEGRDAINKMVSGVVCVMVDEVHSAKAAELKELLTGPLAHIPLRWGLTGTVPKAEFEYLALFAGLGPVVGEIRAAELQEKGVLANCQIDVLQLVDDHVDYRVYQDEYKYLTTDPERLEWVAKYCTTLGESGNTLILVNNIETGKTLTEAIPGASFVYGNTKSKDRKKEYKEVQGATNKIIIATYGVAAVGINIPRIFNLVLFEAGKSYTRVIQSVGRGIRKADDKDKVYIVDMCSTAKFSKKHLAERKNFYKEASYPFKIHKVTYR